MNKIRLLLLTSSFLISTLTFGQAEKREKLTVGFMCGVSAGTTPLVDKMTVLIKEKKNLRVLYLKLVFELFKISFVF